MKRHHIKEHIGRWQVGTYKEAQNLQSLGKEILKLQWDNTTHLPGWIKFKRLKMLSAGEDVKQQELSHIVARMQHGAVILEKFNSFLWNCKYTYHMTQQSNCWVFTKINKNRDLGLPWWCSGWESACQCRGHGFEPWSGKIPHAAEQLGPWATITDPARLEPVLRNKRGCDSERPAHRDEEWPPLATTRESPRTETKTQHSQK